MNEKVNISQQIRESTHIHIFFSNEIESARACSLLHVKQSPKKRKPLILSCCFRHFFFLFFCIVKFVLRTQWMRQLWFNGNELMNRIEYIYSSKTETKNRATQTNLINKWKNCIAKWIKKCTSYLRDWLKTCLYHQNNLCKFVPNKHKKKKKTLDNQFFVISTHTSLNWNFSLFYNSMFFHHQHNYSTCVILVQLSISIWIVFWEIIIYLLTKKS